MSTDTSLSPAERYALATAKKEERPATTVPWFWVEPTLKQDGQPVKHREGLAHRGDCLHYYGELWKRPDVNKSSISITAVNALRPERVCISCRRKQEASSN
jgi:hypothetical protein